MSAEKAMNKSMDPNQDVSEGHVGDWPVISIIVPVYNVAEELERCVNSIEVQSYPSIEVILVDDGSTDESGKVCDEIAAADSRFTVIHKDNGGLSSARNAGLNVAAGDWVMYIDSDDAIEPDACESLMEAAEKTGADLIIGDAVHETSSGVEQMKHDCLSPNTIYQGRDAIIQLIHNHQFYAPAWFNMYRRSILLKHSLYFAKGLLHEDMEMQPRLFLSIQTLAYTGNVFYRYIDRGTSIMNASKAEKRANAMKVIYGDWMRRFRLLDDAELQRALYGHLAKCYLHSCLELGFIDLRGNGIDASFLFKYGLDAKEKAKAVVFAISPNLWTHLGVVTR